MTGQTQPRGRLRVALSTVLVTMLALTLAAVAVPAAAGDDLEDQRRRTAAEQRAVNDAIERLEHDLADTSAELIQAMAELEGIKVAIGIATEELRLAEIRLAELQREAAIIAERLEAAEAEEASITEQIENDTARAEDIRVAIGRMARDAYRGEMATSSWSAILDAENTDELAEQTALAATALRTQTQALRDLEQINGVNRNRQARLVAVREVITDLKAEVDAKVAEADVARAEAEAHKDDLAQLETEQQAKTAFLESKRQEMLDEQREYEAQQAALATKLRDILRQQEEERRRQEEERRRREAASGGSSSGGGSGGSSQSRPLSYPVPPPVVITSQYGWRLHPVLGIWRLHAGTDFRAYCGNPIIAARGGTVQWATYLGGYGNQIMLNHGYNNGKSLLTSYSHLSSFAVSPGQSVNRGQVIGYSGNTGTSTACHLHFEVYVGGSTVNPMTLIG